MSINTGGVYKYNIIDERTYPFLMTKINQCILGMKEEPAIKQVYFL